MATPIWNEKEKRWELRVQINKVPRKFTCVKPGIAGKREVLRRARDWEDGKGAGEFVSNIWPRFLGDVEKRCGHGVRWTQCELYGRVYILPAHGKRKVRTVTQSMWQSVINDAKPQKRLKKDGSPRRCPDQLSRKTLSNLRDIILSFCRYCHADQLIDTVPERLYLPQDSEEIGKEILSIKQMQALFGIVAAPGVYWYANAWKMMLIFGYRPGEVYGLKHSDIDHTVLTIRRSVTPTNQITPGKNKNARRRTYLSAALVKIFNDQQTMLNRAGIKSEWIFPSRDGSQPVPKTSYDEFQRWGKEVGFRGSPYALRHTCTSYLKDQLPEHMLKKTLGHSKDMDTIGIYGHEVDGELKKAADIVDGFFMEFLS